MERHACNLCEGTSSSIKWCNRFVCWWIDNHLWCFALITRQNVFCVSISYFQTKQECNYHLFELFRLLCETFEAAQQRSETYTMNGWTESRLYLIIGELRLRDKKKLENEVEKETNRVEIFYKFGWNNVFSQSVPVSMSTFGRVHSLRTYAGGHTFPRNGSLHSPLGFVLRSLISLHCLSRFHVIPLLWRFLRLEPTCGNVCFPN